MYYYLNPCSVQLICLGPAVVLYKVLNHIIYSSIIIKETFTSTLMTIKCINHHIKWITTTDVIISVDVFSLKNHLWLNQCVWMNTLIKWFTDLLIVTEVLFLNEVFEQNGWLNNSMTQSYIVTCFVLELISVFKEKNWLWITLFEWIP